MCRPFIIEGLKWYQLIPKTLTENVGGVILKKGNGENKNKIKSEEEVEAYLQKLKYALDQDNTIIKFQENRQVDSERSIKETNKYTLANLFPEESPQAVIKKEHFHFSTRTLTKEDFPYNKTPGEGM